MSSVCWTGLLATIILTLVGCGDDGPKRYVIQGSVSFNGEIVPTGEIMFNPVGGIGRPDATEIVDGVYELPVTVGEKEVRISAASTDPKLVGNLKQDPRLTMEVPREYIPEIYNRKSNLNVSVKAESDQVFDFDLTSK